MLAEYNLYYAALNSYTTNVFVAFWGKIFYNDEKTTFDKKLFQAK